MIWALDMDDFSGKFCRKTRRRRLKRFPLIKAMKKVFEQVDVTTQMTTMTIQTTTSSNETSLINDQYKLLLDLMFEEASLSSSTSSKLLQSYFILFIVVLINYFIQS